MIIPSDGDVLIYEDCDSYVVLGRTGSDTDEDVENWLKEVFGK